MNIAKSFCSDNYSGIHPEILEALAKVNYAHVPSYGKDIFSKSAINKIHEHFGNDIDIHFVATGTAANILALKTMLKSINSIVCTQMAHINVDEGGAAEKILGSKLLIADSKEGKINVESIKKVIELNLGNIHRTQPAVISITQPTEIGTVYQIDELKQITSFAREHNMLVHMDGARIYNAAVALGVSLREITRDIGIDVLSLGGSKNGMMVGEAILFFNKDLGENFIHERKQAMQLVSKMRFVSAQFEALLSNNLWYRNAYNANRMAKILENHIKDIPELKITQKVESNALFVIIPNKYISRLQSEFDFYVLERIDSEKSLVRWMTSFDTTEDDVNNFARLIKELSGFRTIENDDATSYHHHKPLDIPVIEGIKNKDISFVFPNIDLKTEKILKFLTSLKNKNKITIFMPKWGKTVSQNLNFDSSFETKYIDFSNISNSKSLNSDVLILAINNETLIRKIINLDSSNAYTSAIVESINTKPIYLIIDENININQESRLKLSNLGIKII